MVFSLHRRQLLMAVFAAALMAGASPLRAEPATLSAADAHEMMQSGRLLMIDVRSEQEWEETGVASGAKTVTIHNRGGLPAFVAEVKEVVGSDKDRPVAFICASGVRSTAAARLLRSAGYNQVLNVREGMLGNNQDGPGWIARGLPTQPCTDC